MSGRIPLLAGILVVQLILVGLVSIRSTGGESVEPFLAVEPDSVTGLTITDSEGGEVTLSRTQSGWQLADGLPADSSKVDEVISALAGETVSWPVATSASSQERFEVTEEHHQRRVVFEVDGEVTGEVYLGTSPGFRRVHARAADSEAVYSIDFAVHQVPVKVDDWLDKNLLRTEEISEVTLSDGWRLTRDEEGEWLLDGSPADQEAARRVIDRLEGLSVLGLYDGDEEALSEPRSIDLVDAEGGHRLTIRHDENEDEYVLTSDGQEGAFNVAAYIAEQILIDAEELRPEPEAEPEPDVTEGVEATAEEG